MWLSSLKKVSVSGVPPSSRVWVNYEYEGRQFGEDFPLFVVQAFISKLLERHNLRFYGEWMFLIARFNPNRDLAIFWIEFFHVLQ